jgi:hypothetical protein
MRSLIKIRLCAKHTTTRNNNFHFNFRSSISFVRKSLLNTLVMDRAIIPLATPRTSNSSMKARATVNCEKQIKFKYACAERGHLGFGHFSF